MLTEAQIGEVVYRTNIRWSRSRGRPAEAGPYV